MKTVLAGSEGIEIDDEIYEITATRNKYEYIMRVAMFSILFSVPSLLFAFIYVLIYGGAIAWLSVLKGDMDKPWFVEVLSQ